MIPLSDDTDFDNQCRAEGYLIEVTAIKAEYKELRTNAAKSLSTLN